MEDINLTEYFKGKPGDRGCLLCPQVSQTNAEFAKHLWTHKETEAGTTINKNERSGECPYPDCEGGASVASNFSRHMDGHTGRKQYVCPHLVEWEGQARKLCGYKTNFSHALTNHRASVHKYNKTLKTAASPWVEKANVALSVAELHFGANVARARDENNADIQVPKEEPKPILINDDQEDAPAEEAQAAQPPPQPQPQPQPANANAPPPYVPQAEGHHAPGAHHHDAHPAGMNQGPFAGAAHVHGHPHAMPGGPLRLSQVEITRIVQFPNPFGHLVTQIEKRTYA